MVVSAGVVKSVPVFTNCVNAASLYQLNCGELIVVLDALNVADEPLHTVILST
ncbi:hypothetical protein D3C72_564260 [compost metagenome]